MTRNPANVFGFVTLEMKNLPVLLYKRVRHQHHLHETYFIYALDWRQAGGSSNAGLARRHVGFAKKQQELQAPKKCRNLPQTKPSDGDKNPHRAYKR